MNKKVLIKNILGMVLFSGIANYTFAAEDAELKLHTNDGSSKMVVQNKDAKTVSSFDSGGNIVTIGTATIAGSGFSVGGSTFVVKDGNVGIGTTTPGASLDVQGTYPQFVLGKTANAGLIRFRRPSDGGANGYVGFDTSQTVDGPFTFINANGTGEVRLNAYASDGFVTAYTNNAERLRIDGSGNVGIGTTTPTVLLELKGDHDVFRIWNAANNGRTDGFLFTTAEDYLNGSYGGLTKIKLGANDYWGTVNSFGYIAVGGAGQANDDSNKMYFSAADSLTKTNGVVTGAQVTIQENGNVGIGTASPGQKLEVNGALKLAPGSAPTAAEGSMYYDSAQHSVYVSTAGDSGAWLQVGSPTSCPSGMALMGKGRAAYCIETSDRGAMTYANASNACLNEGRYLCTFQEFSMACNNLAWGTSAWRWVPDPYGQSDSAIAAGNGGCFFSTYTSVTTTYPFRCCRR